MTLSLAEAFRCSGADKSSEWLKRGGEGVHWRPWLFQTMAGFPVSTGALEAGCQRRPELDREGQVGSPHSSKEGDLTKDPDMGRPRPRALDKSSRGRSEGPTTATAKPLRAFAVG